MTAKPVPTPSELSGPYWDGAARGELMCQRCRDCGTHFLHAREWCPACGSTDVPWVATSGRGEVLTYTVVSHAPYEAFEQDTPYVIAIVRLSEGAQLMCNIVETDPDSVDVGLPVSVTFEQRGAITLPQFRPSHQSRSESPC
ncbi:protein of unknown function DUF35 [Mycolicibacterium rhodesiae JS60]|nr:protein of unknown function DUF35 [Mycolicibacterium rhodesiae JS60]